MDPFGQHLLLSGEEIARRCSINGEFGVIAPHTVAHHARMRRRGVHAAAALRDNAIIECPAVPPGLRTDDAYMREANAPLLQPMTSTLLSPVNAYLYRSIASGCTARLEVDENGMILAYEGQWASL
ncbi:hypothetical protein [Paenibacillus thiaminolyticus]|uniref:hypothetical protein n=1 Tax=Paenibacillus thiaminolyticus TaxID=49283 RepID=UPI0015FF2A2F|nr:hypothetical protein [Paenibacillus thiaminolyticus]